MNLFDEKYENCKKTNTKLLKAVYIQNSEAFVSEADVAGDMEILKQIESRSK